jgi:hypothetical protein
MKRCFPIISIPISFSDLAKDVDLPVGKRLLAEVLGQGGSDLRENALFSCIDLPNRLRYLLQRHTFEQVGMGARLQRALDLGVAREHCQQYESSFWKLLPLPEAG